MLVGVPAEIKDNENRIAMVPGGAHQLAERGHTVLIEQGGGIGSDFSDQDYIDAGAEIVATPAEIFARSDMIVKVKEPQPVEYGMIRPNQIVFTYFHFAASEELTRGMMGTGVPERRTPGFWENISQCGGTAGMGEFFLSFYRMTGDERYRAFVQRLNDDLLRRSENSVEGRKWIQSEHRVRPELLVAQTGFMQGAAGVGKYFLHMDSMETSGSAPAVIFPDAPY